MGQSVLHLKKKKKNVQINTTIVEGALYKLTVLGHKSSRDHGT